MRENISTVIMSVLLALIVWFFAIDQENPLVNQELQEPIFLEVRGLADGMQTRQNLTNRSVNLTLRAPRRTWDTIQPDDFTAYIDLEGLGPDTHDVPVRIDGVNPAVEVVDIQPEEVRVYIEPIISKMVPIQVEIMDSPAFSYEWRPPVVEPEQVTVRGPKTQVDQVRAVTAEVYLRNARSQVETTEQLSPRNSQNAAVDRVTLEPQAARIIVPIEQLPGRKEVSVLVPIEGQPAPGYSLKSITAEPDTIVLRGSTEALRSVPGYVETPPLNMENATSDIRERLPLILPENVSTAGENSVTAVVVISPIESSTTVSRRPVVQGLSDELRADVSLQRVDVILSGPLPRLDSLTSDDVRVTLDLSGLSPGSHVIVPSIVSPEGILVEGIIPQSVEVVIESLATPTATPSEAGATATASPSPTDRPPSGDGTPAQTATPRPDGTRTATPTPTLTATPTSETSTATATPTSGSD